MSLRPTSTGWLCARQMMLLRTDGTVSNLFHSFHCQMHGATMCDFSISKLHLVTAPETELVVGTCQSLLNVMLYRERGPLLVDMRINIQ